jgi:endo-1,4-beta-xylanase
MPPISRRDFLAAAAASAAVPPLPKPAESLAALAAAKGITFGSEVLRQELADAEYAALVARECAMLVPGWEAKWDHVEPRDGVFDFAPLDAIVDFAERHGMQMRMHTLVWSLALPRWLPPALADGRGPELLRRHIMTVAGRYRGRVAAWDVCNEITDPRWSRGPEGLTLSPWRKALGPDYVETAFRLAGEADPDAKLFLNDDDLEYDEPDREAKRTTYLRLIEGWKRRGVPIHGFGLQAHLKPERRIAELPYRRFLAELAGMGLILHVTELDVHDRTLPGEMGVRDRAIAELVRRYLDLVLDEPATRAVLTWGLTTRYTYMTKDPETLRDDNLPPRGLPYDSTLQPTPMRDALVGAFKAAPKR